MAEGRVVVRVFGGVEAELDGVRVPLPARLHRALLAVLALEAGRVVGVDTIVDALWGETPPATAVTTLQGYVAALRRALEPGRPARTPARVVVTRGSGYLLDVPAADVDALAVEAAARAGAEALAGGRHAAALAYLEPALARWHGEPAPELAGAAALAPVLARLAERRATAAEDRAEALLALGRAGEAVAGLEQLVAEDPLRERRQALLARSLAATGRQADALAVVRRARRLLADELGLDPSSVLRDAETALLAPAALLPGAAPAAPAAGVEVHTAGAVALRARVAALGTGAGGVVVVAGPPGCGKSTLVDRVAAQAEAPLVLRTTCPDAGTAPGFWPLRRLLADLPGETADAARAVLAGAGAPAADGASAQFLAYDAVAAALHDAARRTPLLLVVDDAHAADASTVAVLELLAPDLARLPVLAVLAVRDPVPVSALPLAELAARPGGSRIDLGALPPAELAVLGAAVLGRRPEDGVVAAVADRSGGNAFFAAELFRAAGGEDGVAGALPGGVVSWTAAQVARLTGSTRTLVRLAALAGIEVDVALLSAVSGRPALDVVRALDAAVAAGLLAAGPGGTLRFAHALPREAVAAGCSPGERAALHVALADALPPSGAASAVAAHLLAAGGVVPVQRVVAATLAASGEAVRAGAWAEAAALLGRGVDAVRGRGDGTGAWALLVELGRVRRSVGDTVGAYAAFDEALALASRQGDEAQLRTAAAAYGAVALWGSRPVGQDDPRLVTLLERAAQQAADRGEVRDEIALRGALACELAYGAGRVAAGHAERAVELARASGDPQVLVTALHHAWRANGLPWLARQQLARDDEALALLGGGLLGAGTSRLTELVLRLQRVTDLAVLGRLAELDRELTTCRLLAGEVRSPELSAQLGYCEAGLAMLYGQVDRAVALASRASGLLMGTSRPDARWSALAGRWGVLLPQGRSGEMAHELVAAVEDPLLVALRPAAALAVLDAGDEARACGLAQQWFGDPPLDWAWMGRVACWAHVSARTGVPDPARLRDLLAPCTGLLAVTGSILDCGGSVDALLAGLELRLGNRDEAHRLALAAQRQESDLGLRGWARRTAALVAAAGG